MNKITIEIISRELMYPGAVGVHPINKDRMYLRAWIRGGEDTLAINSCDFDPANIDLARAALKVLLSNVTHALTAYPGLLEKMVSKE